MLMKLDRSEEWWLKHAESEGHVTVGAGASSTQDVLVDTLKWARYLLHGCSRDGASAPDASEYVAFDDAAQAAIARAENAAMIAAAPDILAALRACLAYIPGSEVHNWPPGFELRAKALKLAKAALLKAEAGA
jgi:hypothetical protein